MTARRWQMATQCGRRPPPMGRSPGWLPVPWRRAVREGMAGWRLWQGPQRHEALRHMLAWRRLEARRQ